MIAVVAAVAVAAGGSAEAKVRCSSGTTAFVDGKLRIFGVRYRTPDEWGFEEYACLGRRFRPLIVGGVGSSTGLASGDTPAYAFAGGRYLAAYDFSDGEGGPSSFLSVIDLRTRRVVSFMNLACCEGVPAFRVAPDGTLAVLAPGDGVLVKAPGRRARSLAETGTDLAMAGGTVYWSEAGQPRSAALDGVGGDAEALMLEPVRLRRRGGACAAARGRTIAASGSVRVFERAGERHACRIGRTGSFDPGQGGAAPRIVADRWLVVRSGSAAWVIDSRRGRAVTVLGAGVRRATLLRDGTLAWLEPGGRLLVQRPGSGPVVLAPSGASFLAAARRAVYWTEAGTPRVYRASAARSASKPG